MLTFLTLALIAIVAIVAMMRAFSIQGQRKDFQLRQQLAAFSIDRKPATSSYVPF
jgi:hypothetical protein